MTLFHRMSGEGCAELHEIVQLGWVVVSLFCLFLPKQPPSQLIGLCDMRLWFIDLANKLLNCYKVPSLSLVIVLIEASAVRVKPFAA